MNKICICMIVLTFTMSGCLNVAMHKDGSASIYGGTEACAKLIATPFVGAEGPESAYAEAYATLALPLNLIDLPFEVVADTVTLPYDFIGEGEHEDQL